VRRPSSAHGPLFPSELALTQTFSLQSRWRPTRTYAAEKGEQQYPSHDGSGENFADPNAPKGGKFGNEGEVSHLA